MTKIIGPLFLLICVSTLRAQYTDVINANRPGFTENAYGVGKDVFQVEDGLTFIYGYPDSNQVYTSFQNLLYLRHGFFSERLEVNLQFQYNYRHLQTKNLSSVSSSAFEPLGIGAKYLIYDHTIKSKSHEIRSWKKRTSFNWSKLIPSVAIKTNYLLTPTNTEPDGFAAGLLLHNQMSTYWNIVTNVSYVGIDSKNPQIEALISSTYGINDQWSSYLESRNLFSDLQKTYEIGLGFAYLINKDLQIDASVRGGLVNSEPTAGISTGISWRLDRHKDQFVAVKPEKPKKEKDPNRASFVSRAASSTKEAVVVAGIYTGMFFSNPGTDISIFVQNLFLKKENHIPKRNRNRKPKKAKTKDVKKPVKGKRFEQESKDYKSGKTAFEAAEKERIAKEKAAKEAAEAQAKLDKQKAKEAREAEKAAEKAAKKERKAKEKAEKEALEAQEILEKQKEKEAKEAEKAAKKAAEEKES